MIAMATGIAKSMAKAPAKEKETAKEKANQQHVRTSAQVMNAISMMIRSVKWRKSLGAATMPLGCFLKFLINFVRKHVENAEITWDTLL